MDTIYDKLLAVERCEDVGSLKRVVREATRQDGYDRLVVVSMSAAADDLLTGIYCIEGEWFDDDEALDAETYVRHCPVTRHVLETDKPFFWTKLNAKTGKRYRFVDVPRGQGLHGLQVPVFGHAGLIGAVSFGGEQIDSTSRARFDLTQIGTTAFLAARRLLGSSTPRAATGLSERELEVLRWIASGRRTADVAATLGLSDRTVENHLRRIRQRLQVKTTAQAVSVALSASDVRS